MASVFFLLTGTGILISTAFVLMAGVVDGFSTVIELTEVGVEYLSIL